MTKELEALSILVEKSIYGNQEDNRGSIFESERIIEQALTPPTSKEVCEALSEYFNRKVVYKENYLKEFFYEWAFNNNNGSFVIASMNDGKVTLNESLSPCIVTLISRFYEGVVENG